MLKHERTAQAQNGLLTVWFDVEASLMCSAKFVLKHEMGVVQNSAKYFKYAFATYHFTLKWTKKWNKKHCEKELG